MASLQETETLLKIFIDDEDMALKRNEQGSWYPMNWFRIKPVLRNAPKVLAETDLITLYAHLIRLGYRARAEIKNTYTQWEAGYIKQHPFMLRIRGGDGQTSLVYRLEGLIVYGFDYKERVDANEGFDEYMRYRSAYDQCSKYESMPGILAKPDRFIPFAHDEQVVKRLCAALNCLGFMHDDWYRPDEPESAYSYTCLPFWASLYLLLLSPFDAAAQTLTRFRTVLPSLPRFVEQQEALLRFEAASSAFLKKTT